jgi:hypothetical protein
VGWFACGAGWPGTDVLRFELTPEREGSVLVLTASLGELGKAARDGAGWHECLDRLVQDVAGDRVPPVSAGRWRQLRDPYIARFGPDASTIGPPPEWERARGTESGQPG